jgi:hypothetical protein
MPRKKLRVVSLDEVRITRRGHTVEFEYADEGMGGMSLHVGVDVGAMSDDELLEKHNQTVLAMEAAGAAYEHVAVEVPIGRPQIRYFELGDQWTPRGHVLRCVVHDGGHDGEVTIEIDDRELSLREFGRLLSTFAGWGMRLVFVPDDSIHEDPVIKVREPEDPQPPSGSLEREIEPISPRSRMGSALNRVRRTRDEKVLLRLPVYRLRVTLAGTEPAVWRSVLVSGNQSLRKLHDVIQAAMGWTNSHLHLYASADRKDIVSDPRFELDGARDEGRVKVRSFAPEVGHRFLYEYDLGDSWTHDVLVEEILLPEKAGRLPRCIGGERACPPEDCGGVSGFLDLIEAMRDPSHPEREHYLEWLGRAFDPEAFDVGETNDRLRRLR